jgi:hypothetical protein
MHDAAAGFLKHTQEGRMIEGFKIRVASKELRDTLLDRAEYHRNRAETKQVELPKLREAMEMIKAAPAESVAHFNKASASYAFDPADAIENLERDIKDHHNKAIVFRFFADHLFDDDYTLGEQDMIRLELVKRW